MEVSFFLIWIMIPTTVGYVKKFIAFRERTTGSKTPHREQESLSDILRTFNFPLMDDIGGNETEKLPYNYDPASVLGPMNWKNIGGWEKCGDKRQSPVNVLSRGAMQCVSVTYLNEHSLRGTFINNGRSAHFLPDEDVGLSTPNLNFNGNKYYFRNLHLHFGKTMFKGSEHTVDGVMYPGEVHLIHWKKDPNTGTVTAENGVLVIAVFLKLNIYDVNDQMEKILVRYISQIASPNSLVPAVINPHALLPEIRVFFSYIGTLTTPPCTGNIQWLIMRQAIYVTPQAFKRLFQLKNTHGDSIAKHGCRRPVQPFLT